MRLRIMRPLLLGTGAFLVTALVPVLAEAGCCLHRDNEQSPWIEIGANFERCQDLNRKNDKDENKKNDIYKRKGNYWWSLKC